MAKLVPVGAPVRRHPAKIKGWLDKDDPAEDLFTSSICAATAMAHGLVVSTRNTGHFSRVKTLRVINWWAA